MFRKYLLFSLFLFGALCSANLSVEGYVIQRGQWNNFGNVVKLFGSNEYKTETSLNGFYQFSNIPAGSYQLFFFDPAGYYLGKREIFLTKNSKIDFTVPETAKSLYLVESAGFLISLIMFSLAVVLFFKTERQFALAFLAITLAFVFLNGGEFLQVVLASLGQEVLSGTLFPIKHLGLVWFGPAFWLLWQIFPTNRLSQKQFYSLLSLVLFETIILLSWIGFGSDAVFNNFWKFDYADFRKFLVLQILVFVSLSWRDLYLRKRNAKPELQKRLLLIQAGLGGFILLLIGLVFIPVVWLSGREFFLAQYNFLASLSGLVLIATIFYAVTAYEVLSFAQVFSRSTAYFMITGGLGLIYALVILGLDRLLQKSALPAQANAYFLMFFIAFALVARDRVVQAIEKTFFGNMRNREKELERASRLAALGTLAAGLAHEIKNPLASINNLVKLLPERYNDKKFRSQFMAIVPRQIDRIRILIADLLQFARPGELKFASVDLKDSLERTLKLIQVQANKHQIRIEKSFGKDLALKKAAPQALEQVFLNFVLNALEAMPKGGVLSVSAKRYGRQLEVVFADNGIGMKPETVKKIFDPFFTTKPEGTGLGLAVVRRILEEHGAVILVDSKFGKGTKFTLRFS